ncbi:MAG: transglycosylase SLT domain-containing protein [Desulfobacterales bacterium]|nr:transglycosylase SLT domain-containing protein [Desulfobacterales bacterium]
MKRVILLLGFFFCLGREPVWAGGNDDPWARLRRMYVAVDSQSPSVEMVAQRDPWQRLRAIYLPFSQAEERRAAVDSEARKGFVRKFHQGLAPYQGIIDQASERFAVPRAVIMAVIMVESGGNAGARTHLSSAKGLMQTIDATFALARRELADMGIHISNDPFDAEASIMAGTWYLSRMYDQCFSDGRMVHRDPSRVSSWRLPLEYYYAGPRHGVKPANKILVFSKGKKRIIDKAGYSAKVLKWVDLMGEG